MKILIISQYYWPEEAGPGVSVTELAESLVKKGYKVSVITGMPNYPNGHILPGYCRKLFKFENHNGVKIFRGWFYPNSRKNIFVRNISALSFIVSSLLVCLVTRKSNVIYSLSSPITMNVTPWILSRYWRVPWISHVIDLFTDAIIQAGYSKGIFTRILYSFEHSFYKKADHIVTNSSDKMNYLIKLQIPNKKITFISDWADGNTIYPSKKENFILNEWNLQDKFIVLFSGNMGYSSDLETVLIAANQLRSFKEIYFILVGEGVKCLELKKIASDLKLANLKFYPFQRKKYFPHVLAASDVTLVTLSTRGAKFATQGKIYTQMAASKPILAITPPKNDIERLINNAECGWWIESGDGDSLAKLILDLETNPDLVKKYGKNARAYFCKNYSIEKCTNQFESLLKHIKYKIR